MAIMEPKTEEKMYLHLGVISRANSFAPQNTLS
jgi:hypothetical protein